MESAKIKNQGTGVIFENRLLEALTRTHFAFPVILYLLIALSMLTYAVLYSKLEMWKVCYLFPLGMFAFSLVEYSIHRWIFHFHAVTEKQLEVKYKIHGVHHEYPRDKDRLVMPPVLSLGMALLFYALFSWIFDSYVWLFFPGFAAGYSFYLLIHYAVHRYRPPKGILKFWWTHHALHHYKSDDAAFAVSNPFWDYLFGTMPNRRKPLQRTTENQFKE